MIDGYISAGISKERILADFLFPDRGLRAGWFHRDGFFQFYTQSLGLRRRNLFVKHEDVRVSLYFGANRAQFLQGREPLYELSPLGCFETQP